LLEVLFNVSAEDHLDDDLANVPVLGLTQQLEDVVLRIQQQLEGNCAVMVLQN